MISAAMYCNPEVLQEILGKMPGGTTSYAGEVLFLVYIDHAIQHKYMSRNLSVVLGLYIVVVGSKTAQFIRF